MLLEELGIKLIVLWQNFRTSLIALIRIKEPAHHHMNI